MMNVQKILFPTDFSECAEHAFSQAAHLASLFDAELHVYNTRVVKRNEHPSVRAFLEDEARDVALQSELRMPTARKSPFLEDDRIIVLEPGTTGLSVCDAILKYAEQAAIDLIVMGTHGRRGPRRFLLGSTAACVVRKAACPVVTLRCDAAPMEPKDEPRLLVPVDFSQHAEAVLHTATELATRWGGGITVVHVIEEMVIPAVYGIEPAALPPMTALIDQTRTELRKLGARIIGEAVPFDTDVLIGPTAVLITEYARERAVDMIMLSTHGLSGFKRMLLGSVAEAVVRSAPCAVLTFKSSGTEQVDSLPSAMETQNA